MLKSESYNFRMPLLLFKEWWTGHTHTHMQKGLYRGHALSCDDCRWGAGKSQSSSRKIIHDASAFSLHGQLESWRCFPSSLCGFGRVPSWPVGLEVGQGGWAVKQDSYGPNMGHQATQLAIERERTHTIGQVLSLTCDKPSPILPLMVKPSQCGIHTIPIHAPVLMW